MAVHLLNKQLEWIQLYWNQQPILNQCHTLWLDTVGKYRMKTYAYEIVRLQECAFIKCAFKKLCD